MRRRHQVARRPLITHILTPDCEAANAEDAARIWVDGRAFVARCPPAELWKPLARYLQPDGRLREPVDHDDAQIRTAAVSWFLAACLPQEANRAIAEAFWRTVRPSDVRVWAESCIRTWWPHVTLTIL